MKKTLLIAAAALAAGIISTQASSVYSQNVVGYYNVTTTPGHYSFFANQLTNGNGNVNSVLNTGFISDPSAANNSQLFVWNGGGYNIYQYFTGADADNNFFATGSVNGWYDTVGNLSTDNINPGSGAFIYNPAGVSITNTVVGSVVVGTNTSTVTAGYNVYSLIPPVSTNIDSAFANFPGTSDPNGITNDQMYIWNGAGYNIAQYFTGADADNNFFATGSVSGWYDTVGNYVSLDPAYTPKVAQAFFIFHTGASKTWTYTFSVQ